MADVVILVGSVYGGSEEVAEAVQAAAESRGLSVRIATEPRGVDLSGGRGVLVVTSTTGSGELPDNIQPFYADLQAQPVSLSGRPLGVIALGDSSYGETFCAGGQLLEDQLQDLGARSLQPMLKIDAMEFFQATEGIADWVEAWLDRFQQLS